MTSPRRGLTSAYGTSTGDEHWAERAACRSVDPELFFTENPVDIRQAKSICGGCDVQTECLRGALDRREGAGVWGGELFIAGRIVQPKPRTRSEAA